MDAFDPNGPGGYPYRGHPGPYTVWFNMEYLMWFQKAAQFGFPVVTSGSPVNGAIPGLPDTQVLYGNKDVTFGLTNGVKLTGGMFFDPELRIGMEVSGFLLEQRSQAFLAGSNLTGGEVLGRPYIDPSQNLASSVVITSPNYAAGGIAVSTTSRTWGAEGNMVYNLYRSSPVEPVGYVLSLLGGFRYAEHDGAVDIITRSTLLNGASINYLNQNYMASQGTATNFQVISSTFDQIVVQNTTVSNTTVQFQSLDQFKATNRFYGVNLGLYQELTAGRWSLALTGKIALGVMDETVQISGGSTLIQNISNSTTQSAFDNDGSSFPTTTTSFNGQVRNSSTSGIQVQSNNAGKYHRDVFGAVPEGILTVNYRVSNCITLFAGYDVLYFNRVVQPTALVNGQVNQALLPTSLTYGSGTNAPAVNVFKETDFWAQGVNIGLSIRY